VTEVQYMQQFVFKQLLLQKWLK